MKASIDYNKEEVMDYCYKSLADIRDELQESSSYFFQMVLRGLS